MTLVNQALTGLFDLLLGPLDRLPPLAGLTILALVTAIAVLLAFKWTADQEALAAAKQAMQAAIFEMRLFNDDLVLLFRAQGEVIRRSLTYLRLSNHWLGSGPAVQSQRGRLGRASRKQA